MRGRVLSHHAGCEGIKKGRPEISGRCATNPIHRHEGSKTQPGRQDRETKIPAWGVFVCPPELQSLCLCACPLLSSGLFSGDLFLIGYFKVFRKSSASLTESAMSAMSISTSPSMSWTSRPRAPMAWAFRLCFR